MNTEQNLRQNILQELKKLTPSNSPFLYKMIQTKQGYNDIEKIIIEKVLHENLPPIAIIPQIESDYSINELENE